MRNKGALAFFAILVAIAGVSFLVYRLANRPPRTTARAGLADSGTSPLTPDAAPAAVADSVILAATQVASTRPSVRPAFPRTNPYAIVRDGICVSSNAPDQEKASRQKWEALLRDPFWRSIFSGVNPEEFSLVKTSLPLDRYVAYWKMENQQLIHWTGKKILVPAGTRVLTDGRGRMYLCACGNQVAAVLPATDLAKVLTPEQEPPVAYLVPPEPEPFFVIPREVPAETPVVPSEFATTPPYDKSDPLFPMAPIYVPLDGEPGPGPPPGPPPQPPPGPPPQPPPGHLPDHLPGRLQGRLQSRRWFPSPALYRSFSLGSVHPSLRVVTGSNIERHRQLKGPLTTAWTC